MSYLFLDVTNQLRYELAMPYVIAVVSPKGGAGKSLSSIMIGCELYARGFKVLICDGDPQGSVTTWGDVAAEKENITCDTTAVGDNLKSVVPNLAKAYQYTIIDTAGRHAARIISALSIADLVLHPTRPAPTDLWALNGGAEATRMVQEIRPELKAAILINCKTHNTVAKVTREAIANASLPVLKTELSQRTAYNEAISHGMGISQYATSSQAAADIRSLVDEILAIQDRTIATKPADAERAEKEITHAEA